MNEFLAENLGFCLQGRRILLGITGSIAAFKSAELVRLLKKLGAEVRVLLSPGAENFVARTTLETLSGNRVAQDFWGDSSQPPGTHHIETARWGERLIIAPATAHCLAKLALGLADDLLSTEALAFRDLILVAPAMNPTMLAHPAVQAHLDTLRARGVLIMEAAHGLTACGEIGEGRMEEPTQIIEHCAASFFPPPSGKKTVITSGSTQSSLDPVRHLTNRSSGQMGAALAWAALEAGDEVVVIAGPSTVEYPQRARVIHVRTVPEMQAAVEHETVQFDRFFGVAAVLDWLVENPSLRKLKHQDGPLAPQYVAAPDLLRRVGERKHRHQFVLGFAAETQDFVANGLAKLRQKHCSALFVNPIASFPGLAPSDDPGVGIDSRHNGGWWLLPDHPPLEILPTTKPKLAREILRLIGRLS